MDERKRFRAFIGVLAAVIVTGVIFIIGSAVAEDTDNQAIALSAVILVSIALVGIVVARAKLKELRDGFPSEDERSTAMKMRVGYLAFWTSMYFCFALGIIIGIFVEDAETDFIPIGELMFVLVAAMGIFYIAIYAALSRGKGTTP